jgi:hypothetical protein
LQAPSICEKVKLLEERIQNNLVVYILSLKTLCVNDLE